MGEYGIGGGRGTKTLLGSASVSEASEVSETCLS